VRNEALIFKPQGKGPFPAVVYNHGMVVDLLGLKGAEQNGYELRSICRTLAESGYLVFAPIRKSGKGDILGHKYEVGRAIEYVKSLPTVDSSRIGIIGFSRGGLLSLMLAAERNDLKYVVLLAPAPGGRGYLEQAVGHIPEISAPVLILVEQSDNEEILSGFDSICRALKDSGKEFEAIKYTKGGGHKLFYRVDYYWDDLLKFLNSIG
jgi:dienelactone hydrolase